MPQGLYQWTKPRSLGFHLLFAVIVAGCAVAADWQIHRANSGNTLSYLYAVEWPAIAVVAGIGWWQLVHDTPEDIARRSEHHRRMRAASAEVVARTLPRSALAVTVGSEEIAPRGLPGPSSRAVTAGSGAGPGALVRTGGAAPPADASSPHSVLLPPDEVEPADEMDEYNRYLATLAVKGRPKTWRNPRGTG